MLYTSGTTGRPKGVRLSLAATLASLDEAWRWRRDDRLLHVLPLHHTHGLIVALLGALWAGAEVAFATLRRGGGLGRVRGATRVHGGADDVRELMEAFGAAPPDERARWAAGARGLRLATSGSAALPASLLDELRERHRVQTSSSATA